MTRAESVSGEELQILVQYQLVAALQEREHDLAKAQRLAHIGSWSRDLTTGVVAWSDELYRILGLAGATSPPSYEAFLAVVHPDDQSMVAQTVRQATLADDPFDIEYRIRRPDGSQRRVRSRGEVEVDADGVVVRTQGMVQDLTETHDDACSARDPLTGVASHALFVDAARDVLARAARHAWVTAVLVIDIDRFSDINESYGHVVGDQVLVEIAARLVRAFRRSDVVSRAGLGIGAVTGTVARFGGDRFVVVCEDVADGQAGSVLAMRVLGVLEEPVALGDGEVISVTASVGISVAGPTGPGPEERILDAEEGLRRAKQGRRGSCEVVVDGSQATRASRIEAERALRRALDRGQFVLYYQPKVSLESDAIIGAEALLRWEDPERGLVPPLEFIPLAEETGLIVPIGTWVIQEACRQVARWNRASPRRAHLVVAVNVSGLQFRPELVGVVSDALAGARIAAAQLCLEITESVLVSATDAAIATFNGLAALGVKLSIDDFGTGFSSLSSLKRFPLSELKIDKSFVDGLGRDANDTAIVAATVSMAHALDLSVVAEGVETADQMDRLRVLGCQEVQGYFVSRPRPPEAFAQLLAADARIGWRLALAQGPSQVAEVYRPNRVLIVDDSAEVRQLARMTLVAVGFEVYEADGGHQGLTVARQTRPDCVLLDVSMPGVSGIDVCKALRADPVTAGCTIVMLTSSAGVSDRVEAFSLGADDYVIKPFSPRDLVSRVRAAMGRRTQSNDPPNLTSEGNGARSKAGTEVAPCETESESTAEGEAEILDPVIIANLRSMMVPGDKRGARALIEMFLQATPPRIDTLRAAVTEGDSDAIAASVHSLRGSCASFGVRGLVAACGRIESLPAPAATAVLQSLVIEVEHEFNRAQVALREEFPAE